MINEQMSHSLKKCWLHKSKIFFFLVCFIYIFFYLKNEQFAHSLFFGERCEQIAQVTHQKWGMWASRSDRSPKMSDQKWANEQIACFFFFHSFFHKKRAIRSENRCVNSQPRVKTCVLFLKNSCTWRCLSFRMFIYCSLFLMGHFSLL